LVKFSFTAVDKHNDKNNSIRDTGLTTRKIYIGESQSIKWLY